MPLSATSSTYTPPSYSSASTYVDFKEWLKNTESAEYHVKTPYDPIYAHPDLKCIDVLEYIINNNWDISWDYTDARVPNSNNYYANTTCTSSNGVPRRRR